MLERVELSGTDATDVARVSDCPQSAIATKAHGQRLLFLLSTLRIGGSERKVVRLANAMVREGRSVTVAYLNGPDPLREQLDSRVPTVDLQRTGKFSPGALQRLSDVVARERVDTVIAINMYAMLYAALLKKTSSRAKQVRFLSSLNTTDFHTRKQRVQLILYRPLLRAMDRLIFGAEYQRDLWRSKHLSRNSPPSSVLYNGVDTEHFSRTSVIPYRIDGWPSDRLVIGTVGVLRPEKSHDHLLHAVARLIQRGHNVGALIVGEGPQQGALRDLCRELRIEDYVRFCGAARDVRPYLAAMDLFVLTSTAVETFSNAALEAMAMGCPVISSAIGGMPEMLREGGGFTYRIGDVNELTDRLEKTLAQKPALDSMSARAVETVAQRFSLEATVTQFRTLIESEATERY